MEQGGLWLCCWPQQCAFVGVTGPGRSNSPWAPDRREGPARVCIPGPACPLPGGQGTARACGPVPCVHYSEPSALSASSLGCLAPRQPAWPCPGAALAQVRWSGDAQEHKDALQSSSGALCSAQPHTLSPRTASGLHTPRGTWLALSYIPLQLQPALSKFLCLMQGGETTQMSKGRAHGALSCWAGGRLFL